VLYLRVGDVGSQKGQGLTGYPTSRRDNAHCGLSTLPVIL
jgi:hypothetical protein